MCFGGGGPAKAILNAQEPDYKNAPVVVTGKQTVVKNPIDTKKFTEQLKIKRQKEEGTYVDPNLTTTEKLTRRGGNKRVIRRVDGKLTSMSRNKYRSTLRSRARNSRMSGSRSNKKR